MEASDFILYAGGIAILVLTGFISYLIFATTKTVQETTKTVADVNKKLEKVDPVFDETTKTITELNHSVQTINDNILKPVASLSGVFKGMSQLTKSFQEGKEIFSTKEKEKEK